MTEFGIYVDTVLYLKLITNKVLLIAQGTLLNVIQKPGWKGSLRENMCICMAKSLCCSSETITILLISCTPIYNKKLKANKKSQQGIWDTKVKRNTSVGDMFIF